MTVALDRVSSPQRASQPVPAQAAVQCSGSYATMSSTSSTFTKRDFDHELRLSEFASPGLELQLPLDIRDKRRILYLAAKRTIDIAGSLAALIVLSPIFLVTALLIKLRDGGPILFVQKRVGKDRRLFDFYKFRS